MYALEKKINTLNAFLLDGELFSQPIEPIEHKSEANFRITIAAIFTAAAFSVLFFKVIFGILQRLKLKDRQNDVLEIIDIYSAR